MKFILLSLSLFLFTHFAYAQQSCNIQAQGGVDAWPWHDAQPFPWDNIQGVWKLSTDSSKVYFKMRVTGENKKGKILNIVKFSTDNCSKHLATGVGFVGAFEKNVVRGILSDKQFRYQVTLGLFDTRQLSSDMLSCGNQVLAASVEVIGHKDTSDTAIDKSESEVELMLLKKDPRTFEQICKRTASH